MEEKKMLDGFKIVSGSELTQDLVNYAEQGALRGVWLGFPNIHEHYTMSLPGVTDWSGIPGSGKNEVLMEFQINTSKFYGWKHLLYMPDAGDHIEILSDIIQKVSGKTFDKRFSNIIDEVEISHHLPWVLEHFKILVKTDMKAKLTPYQFWDLAVEIKKSEGLQTATIDSWKDMDHSREKEIGRTDQYLDDVLAYRNAISKSNNLHLHTIIHSLKTDKDKDGKRKPSTAYDLKGGPSWFDNGKVMVTAHRPDGKENLTEIYWNKVKPRSIGSLGVDELLFDTATRNFYINDIDENGNTFKRYAEKEPYKLKRQFVESLSDDDEDNQVPF
jgi:hypothetical protein